MAYSKPRCIDRFCRLCAKEHDDTITINSPEAESMNLRDKLSKYLLIKIQDNEDNLPRHICINCVKSVQALCSFVEQVQIAQEVMIKYNKHASRTSLLRAALSHLC